MKMTTAISALLLGLSSDLNAQATVSGPRAGAWGAEVSFGGATGGALLRFRNDRSAWLLGLAGQVAHEGRDDATLAVVGARLGIRSLRSPGSATRPIVGGGIVGSISQFGSNQKSWDAGLYGEFGIARFFGESFSVGATSELQARRTERRFLSQRSIETGIVFDVVRVVAAVYF